MWKTNSIKATENLLKKYLIGFDRDALAATLQSNPDYPSLYAISSTLDRYNLPHTAVTADADTILHVKKPFIALLDLGNGDGDFVIINKIAQDVVFYTDQHGKQIKLSRIEFSSRWRQYALIPELIFPSDDSRGNKKTPELLATQAKLHFFYFAACISLFVFISGVNFILTGNYSTHELLVQLCWITIKSAGTTTSLLLLLYEFDIQSNFVQAICKATQKRSCESVLNSKFSRVGSLSWSEIGVAYFIATSGTLLLSIGFNPGIALLSILVFPYTIFSLYYQLSIRAFCPLCLIVQSVITADACFALFVQPLNNVSGWQFIIPLIAMFAILLLWLSCRDIVRKSLSHNHWLYSYKRLLNDPAIFKTLLKRQRKIPRNYIDCSLAFGHTPAENNLVVICNAICGPCAKTHEILSRLIQKKNDLKLHLLFTGGTSEDDLPGEIAIHFIDVYKQCGPAKAMQAIGEWFAMPVKNFKVLKSKYPVKQLPQSIALKHQMNQVIDAAAIKGTPTIYINSYQLPAEYKIEELEYVLS